jgi:DNA polymerase III sliding clamp (beta) subunit (PCNA family)
MKKATLTQDKAKNSPQGGLLVGKKDGQTIIYDDGKVGGWFVGKTHKEGGIQGINKSTGQPIEVQSGEVIITAPALADQTKNEFNGKMMTNREVLSKINVDAGGVAFADGGEVPKKIKRTGASYNYGGKTMTDHEIYKYITEGGIAEDFSIRDIASIHQVPLSELKEQVRLGMKAESEHTKSKREQMKIVKDHLFENPKYYTLLKKAGLEGGGDLISVNVVESKNQKDSFGNNLPLGDKRFDIKSNNKIVGHIVVGSRWYNEKSIKPDYYEVVKSSVKDQNKGIGTKAYIKLIAILDKPLHSDMVRTPQAESVWKKLEKLNLAKKSKDNLAYESYKNGGDEKYEIGGIFHGSPYSFDKFTTERMGTGSGKQIDGWGIYLTDSKDSSKIYGRNIYETTLFKGKDINEYTFIDLDKPVKKDVVRKVVEAVYEKYNKDFDINKFNEYYDYIKYKSLPKVDFNDYELIEFDYFGFLFYKTLSRILGGDKKASLFLLDNGIDGLKRNISKTRIDYIIFDANDITINKKESFAKGGKMEKESLVRDAKSGNTPARDLNNYNDVLDLDADGMVGAETSLYATGGMFNTEPFLNYYFDEIAEFLKYQNNITLNKDFTFKYKGELFIVEPIVLSEKNIKEAYFSIIDSDDEEVGDIVFNPNNNKKFEANSDFFDWNNIKFYDGGDVKPYDANMEGDSADMMFAEGGAVSSVVTNWNQVPSIWKDTSKIKKVAFTNSPYDKGLYSIVAPFLGKDDLRPIMTGINFDENGITVTNAHVLISLPYPSKEFEGVYEADLSKRANPEQITIEGTYPNYSAIIPKKEVTKPFFIDVYKLLQYTNVALKFANKYTFAVNYKIEDEIVGFNGRFLVENLKTLLKLGHETAYAHFIAPNKAVLLTPNEDYEIGNDELILTMPVMVRNATYGVKDIDYNKELSVYYDFNDNEIHNADGSIAEFKMKYEDNSSISKEDVNLLQKLANGKNILSILDYVKVENGVARASDLNSEYYLSGVDLPDGIYKPNNGALEITMEAIEDYPRSPIFVADEDTIQFVISSDILEYYIDKFQNVVGKDDLRPVLKGICLHHTSDNKLFLAGTDANILLKVNITEYVDMPVYNKDMKFIIQPKRKRLYDFLNFTENTALTIKSNVVATIIESDNWSFYARNIDGNYPNYDAVMPRETNKLAVVNLEPIKKAFSGELVKNYVKESDKSQDVFIFNNENEIFIGTSGKRYASNPYYVTKVEKICDTNVDFSIKDYYNNGQNVLLLMPYGYDKQTNFSFRKDLIDRVFKIVNSNKLDLHYTEMNRAYLIPIDSIEYKTTTKEHKVKEQKPSIAETKLVSTINEVNEIKEAIETLEMLLETATRKDKKEIKEAIEVLQMLLDTYEY